MMEGDEYIQASKEKNVESSFNCLEPLANPRKKKRRTGNKRRFSDEQIRSLECLFESESKLEPRKQMQVATDLGLQPRQVAIWFQNRRARWKSKRMEQEYRKLRDEYDNLTSQFESLKKEKESLQLELEKLSDLKETGHEALHSDDQNEKSTPRNENFEDRGHQLLGMDEHVEVQLAPLEKCYSVDPSGLLDQSCNSSQWLDFWT